MQRFPHNSDRRPNVGLKLNKPPACVNCNNGFSFKDPVYPSGPRCPLLLQCGHSACENCIRTLLRSGDTSVTCNLCTKESSVTNKVGSLDALRAEFPLNIYLVGQIALRCNRNKIEDNLISFASSKPKANSAIGNLCDELCAECSEVPAASLCRQCEVALCDPCFSKIHRTAKSLQRHEKGPLIKRQRIDSFSLSCEDHPGQKLEFYCKNCELSACPHCFVTKHKNHDLITLREKNASIISELADVYDEANNALRRLHFSKKKIGNTAVVNTVYEDINEVEKAVALHFNYLHGLLQIKEAELLKEVNTARTCTQRSLQDVSKELDDTIKEVEEYMKIGKIALEPNYAESSDLFATVTRLKDVCQVPCHLVLSQDDGENTQFEFVSDDITQTILNHCKVTVPAVKKWSLKRSDELPEDYEIEDIPVPETAVVKTAAVVEPPKRKPTLPYPAKTRHYSDSDISTTSTDSVLENIRQNTLSVLTEGSVEQVTLCHLLSPNDFYVQRRGSVKNLMQLSGQLNKYATVKRNSPENITVGKVYLVKFNADSKWYRGRVMDMVEDDRVEIYYIDYGNTEKTQISNLRSMPEKFLQLPGMALHCCLCDCIPKNGVWNPEAINIMANITSNVDVTIHVFSTLQTDLYQVDISRKDIGVLSLRDALIFLGLASLTSIEHKVPTLKRIAFQEQYIRTGSTFTSIVTAVTSPSDFLIQRLDENGKHLENLMDEMNKVYCQPSMNKSLVYTPTIGMPVAAQYSLDDKWYRASIVALPGMRKVEVFYVDYGNSEVLEWNRLRVLNEKFLRMSTQALRCSLCDIAPINMKWSEEGEWSEDTISWFSNYTEKKPMHTIVVNADKKPISIVMYEQQPNSDICINALLVKNGYAKSTGENSTVVDFPRTVNMNIQNKPAASVQSKSEKFNRQSMASKKLKNHHKSSSSIHSTSSKQSEHTSSDTSCSKTTVPDDEPEDLFRIPVTVLNVVSPGLFYVSISSQKKQIKQLGEEMEEFYSNVTCHNTEWAVDSKCAVMRKSDKKWYRGVIIEIISEKQIKVLLRDMASVELVDTSNLMPLDGRFLTVRDGAIKCHLSGIQAPGGQNVWPGVASEVFMEELEKYPQKYISKMGNIMNDSLPVELFVKSVSVGGALEPTVVDWKTINQILVARGFALPIRNNERNVVTTSELLKELEDRPTSSMHELVTSWINKTMQECYLSESDPLLVKSPVSHIPRRPLIPGIVNKILSKCETNSKILPSPLIHYPKVNEINGTSKKDSSKYSSQSIKNDDNMSSKSSTSQSSSHSVKLPAKSPDLEVSSPTPSLLRPLSDINSITEWLPAVPFKSLNFKAYPTYVDTLCNIYIQDPKQSKDTLLVIQNALASRYKDSKPMPHDLFWFPGQLCIAQYFSDKCWYRAKVLKVNDNNTVEVQFVDYGNIETCKASELRKNIFMGHIPIQCHCCNTDGIVPISSDGKWPVATLDFIHGTIVDKICEVELKEPENLEGSYTVLSLKCPGDLDLMEILMSMHYATYFIDCNEIQKQNNEQDQYLMEEEKNPFTESELYKSITSEEVKNYPQKTQKAYLNGLPPNPKFQTTSSNKSPIQGLYKICEDLSKIIIESHGGLTYTPAELPKSDECLIEVTGILTALDFVVQLIERENEVDENLTKMKDDFEALDQEMQNEGENLPLLTKTHLGEACCARYSQDNKWYRAKIIEEIEGDKFKVQYVDFGNAEILQRDRIRCLKEEWVALPLQGITVHLWGVHKPRNFNAERTGKMIIECLMLGGSPLTMKIQNRVGTPSVQIFNKDGKLAYQPLLDENLLLNTV